VELRILAQEESVGLAVLGDLPAVRQIGDDRLAAVARVAADQIVEHASHHPEVEEGTGLMKVEMGWPYRDAHAHHAARFGVGLGSRELKLRAVEFQGYFGGIGEAPAHPISASRHGGAALQEIAAAPPRAHGTRIGHDVSPFGSFQD